MPKINLTHPTSDVSTILQNEIVDLRQKNSDVDTTKHRVLTQRRLARTDAGIMYPKCDNASNRSLIKNAQNILMPLDVSIEA